MKSHEELRAVPDFCKIFKHAGTKYKSHCNIFKSTSVIKVYRKFQGRITMLKNRLISALLAASLIAGVTACSTDSANDNGGDESKNTVIEQNEPSDEETEGTSDEDTAGNTTETTTETTAETSGTTTNTKTTKAQKLAVPEAGEDYILFSYEYGNMAWGYQSVKMLFLNNGDVYTFENDPGTAIDKNGRDLAVQYLKAYAEPATHISTNKLKDLYDICKKIDPDVKTEEKSTAKDMGSYMFKFYDPETYQEVLILKTGDVTMTTDDKNLKAAQKKAESLVRKQGAVNEDFYLSLNTNIVNVPYGGKDLIGQNMSFDSYDKLLAFCNKNGIEVEKYLTDEMKKSYGQAKYFILQVYDTNLMVDGYLRIDEKVLKFLPSLADYEYNPAFEGKVTVAIMRFDKLDKYELVNENGTPWK